MAVRDFPSWLRGAMFDSDGVQNLLSAIFDRQNIDLQQELTSVASGDELLIFDVSETGNVKTKKAAVSNVGAAISVPVGNITGLGTGVATALAVNVGSVGAPLLTYAPLVNVLSGNVALNNTSNYFDGPSVAQGTSGTWFASGVVTVVIGAGTVIDVKLWDGTTVIASTQANTTGITQSTVALSGAITSPAGNIKMSVRDLITTGGNISYNVSGNSKDSTLTAIRIA